MPYAATVTVTYKRVKGRKHAIITVAETTTAATDEWSAALNGPLWTLKSLKATKTAGSAATINPILGRAAAFTASTQDHLLTATTTAAHVNETTAGRVFILGATHTLYGRSVVASAADNSVSTEIVLAEGLDT